MRGSPVLGMFCIVLVLLASLGGAFAAGRWSGSLFESIAGVDSLKERNRALEEEIAMLEDLLAAERERSAMLGLKLADANETIHNLLLLLEERNSTINNLSLLVESLRTKLQESNATIMSLEYRIRDLESQIAYLEAENSRLNNILREERERLEDLWNAINESAEWSGLAGPPISLDVLAIAPGTVAELSQELLSGLTSTEERIEAILDWAAINLYYQNDSVVRLVDPESHDVVAWSHSVMLPNETVENGGGDCDDLALLVYALLRATPLPGEKVWIIGIQGFTTGHVAVLVRSPDGLYYIADATGPVVNSVGIYLEMVVENQSDGELYSVWLSPVGLHPGHKKFLLNYSLARIVYDNAIIGPIFPSPEWPDDIGGGNLSTLVWNWQFIAGIIFATEYFIIDGITGYHIFDSRQDLANWVENH